LRQAIGTRGITTAGVACDSGFVEILNLSSDLRGTRFLVIEHPAHDLDHPRVPSTLIGASVVTNRWRIDVQASRWRRYRWLLVAALKTIPRTPSGGAAVVGPWGSHPPRSIQHKRPWHLRWLICCIARELDLRKAVVCANVRGWTSLTVASAHEAENERDKESPRRRSH
jgi:hypothetical protein